MAPRSIGTGSISFGLVSIPVKLYSANESGARISFNQLHKKCRGRVKQQLICPADNEVVPRDDIVKGYEYAKDQYVIFTDEELKAMEEAASKSIDIAEFVPLSSVDPLYFESGYFVGPDKGADRAFKLLTVALKDSQMAAVARYTTRGKQNVVLMRPFADGMVMHQLRYADEVKSTTEIPFGSAEIKDAELALAKQFIQALATDKFQPEKYTDEYRAKLLKAIDQKVKGEELTIAAEPSPAPQVVDLMEALKASLAGQAQAPRAQPTAAAEERKPPKRAPARAPAAKKAKTSKGG